MHFAGFSGQFWGLTWTGLVLGAIYALVALGYTLVYGVLRLINFAHSEVFMLGTFGSFIALKALGVSTFVDGKYPYRTGASLVLTLGLMLVFSMAFSGAAAVVLERLAYRPLRKRNSPRLVFLISAIGASFMISEAVRIWGAKHEEEYALPRVLERKRVAHVLGVDIRIQELIVIIGAFVMLTALALFVGKTRTGRGIRAVAQDADTARLMGVNTDMIIVITFLVGGLMAGAAGFFFEVYRGVSRFDVGFQLGIKSFIAAVLGGIGNLRGALVGGLILGIIENYGSFLFGDQKMGTVVAFFMLVIILLFRPSGLLGETLGRARA